MGDTTGLVSYWLLNDNATTTADGFSGLNTLTEVGDVTGGVTGIFGNAHKFSGSADYWKITDASGTGLDIISDLSFMCWFRSEDWVSTQRVVQNKAYNGYFCRFNATPAMRFGANGTEAAAGSATFAINSAYHAAWVFDNSGNTVRYYVGSTASATVLDTTIAAFAAVPTNNASDFEIGKSGDTGYGAFGGASNVLNMLDELVLFSRVVDISGINDIRASGIAAFAAPAAAGQPMSLRRSNLKAMGQINPNAFQRV